MASRRACEALIRSGRVAVNGRPGRLGQSAHPGRDVVTLDGRPLGRERLSYWMVHKPRGVLTTMRDPQGRRTVLDLLPANRRRLFPVGRLDRESEGLVLLTNDGALAQVLLHPSFESEREYRVTVRGSVRPTTLRRLERGVELEDGWTASARAGDARFDAGAAQTSFSLTVIEGRKRQIRRALSALGHPVVRLLRVRMGPLRLGRLAPGHARVLDARERRALRRLAERAARGGGRAHGGAQLRGAGRRRGSGNRG